MEDRPRVRSNRPKASPPFLGTSRATQSVFARVNWFGWTPLISSTSPASQKIEFGSASTCSSSTCHCRALELGAVAVGHSPSPPATPPELVAVRQPHRHPQQVVPCSTVTAPSTPELLPCVLDEKKKTASWPPAWREGDADRRAQAGPSATSDKWKRLPRVRLLLSEDVFPWSARLAQPNKAQQAGRPICGPAVHRSSPISFFSRNLFSFSPGE